MIELLEEYDWEGAFAFANDPTLCVGSNASTVACLRSDVVEIIAASNGENDGPNWLIVFRLMDGRYGFLDAGCDYTGWDCQAWGSCIVDNDLQNLIRFGLTDDARARLGLQG